MSARRRLIVQPRHPPTNRREGWRAIATGSAAAETARDQLGLGDQLGKLLGHRGKGALSSRRPPAPDPLGPPSTSRPWRVGTSRAHGTPQPTARVGPGESRPAAPGLQRVGGPARTCARRRQPTDSGWTTRPGRPHRRAGPAANDLVALAAGPARAEPAAPIGVIHDPTVAFPRPARRQPAPRPAKEVQQSTPGNCRTDARPRPAPCTALRRSKSATTWSSRRRMALGEPGRR
jgi:hypothetical protein